MSDPTESYVERWFVSEAALARQIGVGLEQFRDMIAAQFAPGVVYSRSQTGEWWSALAGFTGKSSPRPQADGTHWYAPSSAYWLRRGILLVREGRSHQEAAAANRGAFIEQFLLALRNEPLARRNYPQAFAGEELVLDVATHIGSDEWDAWLSGAYAVCLKTFTGESCVAKESLARFLREYAEGKDDGQSATEILDVIERLSIWLMPFAPFERATGTPGLAIDRNLASLALGHEEPFGAIGKATSQGQT